MSTTKKLLNVAYASDTSGVTKGIAKIESENVALASKLKKLGGSIADAGKTMMTHFTAPIVAGFGVAIHLAETNDAANRLLARSFDAAGISGSAALKNIGTWNEDLSGKIGVTSTTLTTMESRVVSMGHAFLSAIGPAAAQTDVQKMTLGMENLSAASGKSLTMLMRSLGPQLLTQPAAATATLVKLGVITVGQANNVKKLDAAGQHQAATQELLNNLYNANAGAASKAATPTAKLEATLHTLGITVGNILMPVFKSVVGWVQQFVGWIQKLSPAGQKTVVMALALVAALGPIVFVTGKMISSFGSLLGAITKVVGFFMIDASAAGADAAAKGVATAATLTLNTAMLASIAIWALIAVAVIAVAVVIVKNWSSIKDFLLKVWADIKGAVLPVWDAIVSAVTTAVSAIWAFLQPIVMMIVDLFKVQFEVMVVLIVTAFEAIKLVVTTVWNAIWSFLGPAIRALVDVWKVEWHAVQDVIKVVWDVISKTLKVAWDGIQAVAKVVWGAIKLAIWNPIKDLADGLKNVWDAVKGAWNTIWGAIKGVVLGTWRTITDGVKAAVNLVITAINWMIDQINKVQIHIHVDPPGPGSINFDWNGMNLGHIAYLASGTANFMGGLALVGEEGPELVGLPAGAQVLPADATRSALAGAGGGGLVQHFHITVQGSVIAERDLMQQVRKAAQLGAQRNALKTGFA